MELKFCMGVQEESMGVEEEFVTNKASKIFRQGHDIPQPSRLLVFHNFYFKLLQILKIYFLII